MVAVGKWSLLGGGRYRKIDCTLRLKQSNNKNEQNLFKKLFSHSGQVLKIVDKNLSYVNLHEKFNRSTPKIFSIYQTSLNFFHAVKTSPEEVPSVTLNDRRNTRLHSIRQTITKWV
jgi:hypothetical protein